MRPEQYRDTNSMMIQPDVVVVRVRSKMAIESARKQPVPDQ
jgi:hypothetical protein